MESAPQPGHIHSLVHPPRAGYWAAKHPGGAEYSPDQGNYLEIQLGLRETKSRDFVLEKKSSFRKGSGLKFGFILGYPLVLGCLSTQTRVSSGLIVLKTFPLSFSMGRKSVWDLSGLVY